MATTSDLVLVEDGTEKKKRYKFSRVPAVGETVKLKDDLYEVTAVTHTPNGTYHLAEIKVTRAR